MHGYNNTEPFNRRTPKRYTYTKNSCAVTITDVNDAPPKHNPALLTRFHFPVLILLSRIATPPFWFLFFQVFPPPLLVFLSMFPAFTGLLLPPQSNSHPQALCLSPPLFSRSSSVSATRWHARHVTFFVSANRDAAMLRYYQVPFYTQHLGIIPFSASIPPSLPPFFFFFFSS